MGRSESYGIFHPTLKTFHLPTKFYCKIFISQPKKFYSPKKFYGEKFNRPESRKAILRYVNIFTQQEIFNSQKIHCQKFIKLESIFRSKSCIKIILTLCKNFYPSPKILPRKNVLLSKNSSGQNQYFGQNRAEK